MSKKKNRKIALLSELSEKLEGFYPECSGYFMCPTCLRTFPTTQTDQITEAHVVPRAAGGKLTTFLCKGCNSDFGRLQDKWFGEHVRVVKSKRHPIEVARQVDYFKINGTRMGGWYEVEPNGPFRFYVRVDRTSPESLAALRYYAEGLRRGGKIEISIPVPLLKNRRLVSVGFLTAAYLLWFKEVGYSFALQAHLEPIREQIRNPTEDRLVNAFAATSRHLDFERPWIGLGRIRGQVALLTGIADRIVLLPPAGSENFYETIGSGNNESISIEDLRIIAFHGENPYIGKIGLMYGDRMVVAPDSMLRKGAEYCVIFIPPKAGPARVLWPTSAEQATELLEKPTTLLIQESGKLRTPLHETGRRRIDIPSGSGDV